MKNGSTRKVSDQHQIGLNFGADPRAAHGKNALAAARE
jgi:hypothetical protein